MINSHLLLSDPRHYKCLTIGGCLVNNSAATIAAAISLWLWNESSLRRKILWKILLKRRRRRVRVPFVSRSIQRLIGATGETITLCFWCFTQPTLIFLSLRHRGVSLKKILHSTGNNRIYPNSVFAHAEISHFFNLLDWKSCLFSGWG